MDGGQDGGVGVPVDVDELGLGEHLQQRRDVGGIVGAFQHQLLALVEVGQLFEHIQVGVPPFGPLFLRQVRHESAGDVFLKPVGEGDHMDDGIRRDGRQPEGILQRQVDVVLHIVHGPRRFEQRRLRLLQQAFEQDAVADGGGIDGVAPGKLGVLAEDVLNIGGAAAPVTQDVEGLPVDLRGLDPAVVDQLFQHGQGVQDQRDGADIPDLGFAALVDEKVVVPKQIEPVVKSTAQQIVGPIEFTHSVRLTAAG